jgi:hypothetical protein
MMAVIYLFKRAVELAAQSLCKSLAENLGYFPPGYPPKTHIAGALEDFADREVALENEIATIFNLG